MNVPQKSEVVASAMDLIEWLTTEIPGMTPNLALRLRNADIRRVVDAILKAANGSSTWEEAEGVITAICRRYEE